MSDTVEAITPAHTSVLFLHCWQLVSLFDDVWSLISLASSGEFGLSYSRWSFWSVCWRLLNLCYILIPCSMYYQLILCSICAVRIQKEHIVYYLVTEKRWYKKCSFKCYTNCNFVILLPIKHKVCWYLKILFPAVIRSSISFLHYSYRNSAHPKHT